MPVIFVQNVRNISSTRWRDRRSHGIYSDGRRTPGTTIPARLMPSAAGEAWLYQPVSSRSFKV